MPKGCAKATHGGTLSRQLFFAVLGELGDGFFSHILFQRFG